VRTTAPTRNTTDLVTMTAHRDQVPDQDEDAADHLEPQVAAAVVDVFVYVSGQGLLAVGFDHRTSRSAWILVSAFRGSLHGQKSASRTLAAFVGATATVQVVTKVPVSVSDTRPSSKPLHILAAPIAWSSMCGARS
jgi:hypothetical protein